MLLFPFKQMVEASEKEVTNIHDVMDDAVESAKAENKIKDEKNLPINTVISKLKNTNDDFVFGAAIKGTYSDHTKKLVEKHKKEGRHFSDTAINLDSFDGAQHNSSVTGQISITSFNTTQISNSMCEHNSTSSSNNILTWMQTEGPETIERILPCIWDHYRQKNMLEVILKNLLIIVQLIFVNYMISACYTNC